MNKRGFVLVLIVLCSIGLCGLWGQQTASRVEPPRTVDRTFNPEITDPAYPSGEGPVVIVDEAHNNFHTSIGLYFPFARLLEKDGYVIQRGEEKITVDLLNSCRIYVIADAQPPERQSDPPTFSETEVKTLTAWVRAGGALFLITDHMPDPGAIEDIADDFGIKVHNGYVIEGPPPGRVAPIIFNRVDNTLTDSVVTNGRNQREKVNHVATFAGSAFQSEENFIPVLVLRKGIRSWAPEEYRKYTPDTPSHDVGGWIQGGILEYGKGRLAFFAEAAMFTAQVFDNGRIKAGMNHPQAGDNMQFLLNIIHWLDGLI